MTKLRIHASAAEAQSAFETYLQENIKVNPETDFSVSRYHYEAQVSQVTAATPRYFQGSWYTVVQIYIDYSRDTDKSRVNIQIEVLINDSSVTPLARMHPTMERLIFTTDARILGSLLQEWVLSL